MSKIRRYQIYLIQYYEMQEAALRKGMPNVPGLPQVKHMAKLPASIRARLPTMTMQEPAAGIRPVSSHRYQFKEIEDT